MRYLKKKLLEIKDLLDKMSPQSLLIVYYVHSKQLINAHWVNIENFIAIIGNKNIHFVLPLLAIKYLYNGIKYYNQISFH